MRGYTSWQVMHTKEQMTHWAAMMKRLMTTSVTLRALWHLRAMMLFLIGPAAGIVLVQAIFGLPLALWWSAGAMSLFMLTIFMLMVFKERSIIRLNTQHLNRASSQSE